VTFDGVLANYYADASVHIRYHSDPGAPPRLLPTSSSPSSFLDFSFLSLRVHQRSHVVSAGGAASFLTVTAVACLFQIKECCG
jgi:hypothetical protein